MHAGHSLKHYAPLLCALSTLTLPQLAQAQSGLKANSNPIDPVQETRSLPTENIANPIEIPLLLEKLGLASSYKVIEGLRIRGEFARQLYNKGVCLIVIKNDYETSWGGLVSQGNSTIVRANGSKLTTLDFKVPAIGYGSDKIGSPVFGMQGQNDIMLTGEDAAKAIRVAIATKLNIPTHFTSTPDTIDQSDRHLEHFLNLKDRLGITYFNGRSLPDNWAKIQSEIATARERFESLKDFDAPEYLKEQKASLNEEIKKLSELENGGVRCAYVAWQHVTSNISATSGLAEKEEAAIKKITDYFGKEIDSAERLYVNLEQGKKRIETQTTEINDAIEETSTLAASEHLTREEKERYRNAVEAFQGMSRVEAEIYDQELSNFRNETETLQKLIIDREAASKLNEQASTRINSSSSETGTSSPGMENSSTTLEKPTGPNWLGIIGGAGFIAGSIALLRRRLSNSKSSSEHPKSDTNQPESHKSSAPKSPEELLEDRLQGTYKNLTEWMPFMAPATTVLLNLYEEKGTPINVSDFPPELLAKYAMGPLLEQMHYQQIVTKVDGGYVPTQPVLILRERGKI